MNYLNITNILEAKIPTPEEDLSENDNEDEFNEHGEAGELMFWPVIFLMISFIVTLMRQKKHLKLIFMGDRKVLREVKWQYLLQWFLCCHTALEFHYLVLHYQIYCCLIYCFPKTLHYAKQCIILGSTFSQLRPPINYHHYYSNCFAKLSSFSFKKCGNCGYDLTVTDHKGYFIEFFIASQLKKSGRYIYIYMYIYIYIYVYIYIYI